jgi:hypothetical protein
MLALLVLVAAKCGGPAGGSSDAGAAGDASSTCVASGELCYLGAAPCCAPLTCAVVPGGRRCQ